MKKHQVGTNPSPSFWWRSLDGPCHGARPSVLVATALDEASEIALRRGDALARLLDAELVVLHVVKPTVWFRPLFPNAHGGEGDALGQQVVLASQATRAWTQRVLGAGAAAGIVVHSGAVIASILEVARTCRASVVVLGDTPGQSSWFSRSSGVLAGLIQDASVPVLVARPERAGHEIVAATNFADTRYPALCQAARLGARLGAHVTFVHNADRSDYVAAASFFGIAVPAVVAPLEPDLDRRRIELEEIAHFIGSNIDTVVASRADTADAILDVARARDADLVVVGARRRRTLRERATLGTAATVARRAVRSVLSVPLREGVISGWSA